MDKPTPKFKQICVGQYSFQGSNSYSVIGLDEEGNVWQFKRDGWIRLEESIPKHQSFSGPHNWTKTDRPKIDKEQIDKEPPW